MIRLPVVALSLAVLSLLAAPRARTQSAAPRALLDTLERLERQSWEAWKNRDGQFFDRFLSDDHVEVGFTGQTNKKEVVAQVSSPTCVVSSYEVDHFTLTQLDAHNAVLTYHAAQKTMCSGSPVPSPVWVTSMFTLRGGRWLNTVYQQTQDLRPPAK